MTAHPLTGYIITLATISGLLIGPAASEPISPADFLSQYKTTLAGSGSNAFVRLTDPAIEDQFHQLLHHLMVNDTTAARQRLNALNALNIRYTLVELNSVASGPAYGILEAVLPGDPDYKGWGAALVRPQTAGVTVYQAPHPVSDQYSEEMVLEAFATDSSARVALFAGTRRDASGDTDNDGEPDADVAHDAENLFHALTVYLATTGRTLISNQAYWFIQLHGARDRDGPTGDHPSDPSDPTIVGSDGAVSHPPYPALTTASPIVQIDTAVDQAASISVGVCGWDETGESGVFEKPGVVDLDGDYELAATTNIQGRFLQSLGLRQTFMHFETERTARTDYHNGSGPGHTGVLELLNALRTVLASPPDILTDTDADGITDLAENGAPEGGDNDEDGIADSQQDRVTSFPSAADGRYISLIANPGARLEAVEPVPDPSPGNAPPNAAFPLGFFRFTITGIAPGDTTTATLLRPSGLTLDAYYQYGPTPGNGNDHWYELPAFAPTNPPSPGVEILSNRIRLRYVDGQLGDADGAANGQITATGGPASLIQTFEISGTITYDLNALNVPDTRLDITGDTTRTTLSSSDGEYVFPDLPNGTYTVTPSKSSDPGGVNATDALQVVRHTAGIETFADSSQVIAADVNNNGTVNATDALKIVRYAAGIDTLPSGNWKFIPPARSYAPLNADATAQDFAAIRMGDVNGTWMPDGVTLKPAGVR